MNMAAFPGKQFLRWRLRKRLELFPKRIPDARSNVTDVNPTRPLRIAYLFSGTYGDFVQALRALNHLAESYPGCDLVLYGANRYAREFATVLPENLHTTHSLAWLGWLFYRRDVLFTNAVGVYRVEFDYIAYFCARKAFGFRHTAESRRAGFENTLALVPTLLSFAEANLNLLELAGVPALPHARSSHAEVSNYADHPAHSGVDPGQIFFHIGSAGLKQDFGLKVYTRLVLGILDGMANRPIKMVMGPGDEDIALEVKTSLGKVPEMYPLVQLIRILRDFDGIILCFNSFLAHLCVYLNRPAIVIHRESVPYGYDCSPLHRQVLLKAENGYDLAEIWAGFSHLGR
jgi:ADP-heptose:LPS heptosyltransferase